MKINNMVLNKYLLWLENVFDRSQERDKKIYTPLKIFKVKHIDKRI